MSGVIGTMIGTWEPQSQLRQKPMEAITYSAVSPDCNAARLHCSQILTALHLRSHSYCQPKSCAISLSGWFDLVAARVGQAVSVCRRCLRNTTREQHGKRQDLSKLRLRPLTPSSTACVIAMSSPGLSGRFWCISGCCRASA